MANSLVIVESPTKVKTINKFLGKDFQIMACMGHVRGLPSRPGSVDVNNDFTPHYEILPKTLKYLNQIKKALEKVKEVYLATDLDREGEAIAWHLVEALNLNEEEKKRKIAIKRIVFHEITESAITEALKHPRKISLPLVDAQQGRVVLDYLFGFNLSPFLWRKVRSGLSAGRVQSPALRMICERELEIRAFKEEEYWTITAELSPDFPPTPNSTFKASLIEVDNRPLEKLEIKTKDQAREIIAGLESKTFWVKKIQKQERKENPPPPFITSTLQQEANTKLGFSAKKTMSIAQKLYEGVEIGGESEGLITYMRTDSFNLANIAVESIRQLIPKIFGPEYLNNTIRRFKQKSKTAQEAHEAIRPTDIYRTPESLKSHLTPDQYKLYDLIWRRTIATQMSPAVEERISVDIAGGEHYLFRAHGLNLIFPGFKKVFLEDKAREAKSKKETESLPPLNKNQALTLVNLVPEQHFTKPPPRYTEASLVKALEEYGIGRPSTYATIISVLQERDYVTMENRRFVPQEIGMVVHKLLKEHFPQYVDYQFTARIEEELDSIARGEISWKQVVRNFWEPFIELIKKKSVEIKKSDILNEPTNEQCPKCGKPLVNRLGPYSRFLACSGYPKCRFIKSNGVTPLEDKDNKTNEICEKCGLPLVIKRGRFGNFLGCSGYPDCNFTKPLLGEAKNQTMVSEERCEKCGEFLVIKKNRYGKFFLSCPNYPKCNYAKSIKKNHSKESGE